MGRTEILNVLACGLDLFEDVNLLFEDVAPFSFAHLIQLLHSLFEHIPNNFNILLRPPLSLSLPNPRFLNLLLLALLLITLLLDNVSDNVKESSDEVVGMGHVVTLPGIEHHLLDNYVTLLLLPLIKVPNLVLSFQIVNGIDDVFLDRLNQDILSLPPGMLLAKHSHAGVGTGSPRRHAWMHMWRCWWKLLVRLRVSLKREKIMRHRLYGGSWIWGRGRGYMVGVPTG